MKQTNSTIGFLGDEMQWNAASIELYDVQGLWGGRRISIGGLGTAVVRLVDPDMRERRYEFATGDAFRRLLDLFIEIDFMTIKPPERAGIPDEARPSLTLVNAAGAKWTVSKWARINDERFDALYRAILSLEDLTKTMEPVYTGPYQPIV